MDDSVFLMNSACMYVCVFNVWILLTAELWVNYGWVREYGLLFKHYMGVMIPKHYGYIMTEFHLKF